MKTQLKRGLGQIILSSLLLIVCDGAVALGQANTADNQAARRYEVEVEGEEIRSSRFANLAAVATAIGSSETNLLVNKPIICNSTMNWPAQSVIKFTGQGRIVFASGCSLTFKGRGVEASPNRQIFSGFTAKSTSPPIKWDTTYPDQISLVWFGASTTATGAANSNAWRLMFDSMAAPIGDGSNPAVVQQGALTYIPPSTSVCYSFDDTVQITKPVILRGGVSAGWYRNTCLSFPKSKTGIYVNGMNTWLAPYTSGAVSAGFTTVENITVIGGGNKHDTPTSPVDMKVDVAAGTLVVTRNALDRTHTFGQDVAHDTTVTLNRFTYAIASKDSPTQLTLHKPRLAVQVQAGATTVRVYNVYAPHRLSSGGAILYTTDWVGQQILIDSKLYTINSISHNSAFNQTILNLSSAYTGTTNAVGSGCTNGESPCHQGTALVQSLGALSNQSLWVNNAHGIDAKSQVKLQNFHVRYFAGNGVHISTSTMPAGAANCAGCVNQNNSFVTRGMIYNVAGHGVALFGQETNSIEVNSVDVSVVDGACFLMGSFLGSVYTTTHCAYGMGGAFFNPFGGGAAGSNRIKNSYVESGTPSSYLSQNDRYDESGGEVDPSSPGVVSNTQSSWLMINRIKFARDYPFHNPGTMFSIGQFSNNGSTPTTTTPQTIFSWGTTEDPDNLAAGGSARRAAPLTYFTYFPQNSGLDGWWSLNNGGLAAYTRMAIATGKAEINYLDTEKITGADARSHIWFPVGLWLGPARHSMRRILSDSAIPSKGQYFKGEVIFNQAVSVGGNAGWINTAKGTPGPGTWNSFGWVYSGISGSGTHQLGSTITKPLSGQVLQWDGAKWVNSTSAGALLGVDQTFTGKQVITGTLTVGSGGSALSKILRGSASLDFPSIGAHACQSLTLTITGATAGDETSLGLPAALSRLQGVSWHAAVTASNTVTVYGCNVTSMPTADPASATVKVTVIQ